MLFIINEAFVISWKTNKWFFKLFVFCLSCLLVTVQLMDVTTHVLFLGGGQNLLRHINPPFLLSSSEGRSYKDNLGELGCKLKVCHARVYVFVRSLALSLSLFFFS